jgi:hypothetical protein
VKTTVLSHVAPTFPATTVAETADSSPALLGAGDELWLAWADTTSPRAVRFTHGLALSQDAFHAAPTVVIATDADKVVGLAQLNGRFYVAWSGPGLAVHIASSADAGKTWSAPLTHPTAQTADGVSLTAHNDALWFAYRDAAWGRATVTSYDPRPGGGFRPVTSLGVPTPSVPAIASVQDPLAWPALHVAVAAAGGKIVASRCFNNDAGNLAATLREVAGLAGDAVTLAPLRVNHQPGLAVGVVAQRRTTISTATLIADPPFFAVQRSDPLSDPGVDLPRMATVDDELFLGYSNLSKRVVAACYIHACALDPSDPRINQDCDPDACPPDPRLVCALQPAHSIRWTPATIDNAMKGDLVLSPADGNGVIGTLLGALTPRQIYDHMGMMVEDQRVIRHCTESKDRLKDKRYYTGVLVVDPAPTDGLRSDHITYGWPGIIHQTVEDAFYTGLRGPYNEQWAPPPTLGGPSLVSTKEFLSVSPGEREGKYPDNWNALMFYDPEENFTADPYRYTIRNLPKDPALRKSDAFPDGELLWPIVVRPPLDAEEALPWVRPLLHRVADASLALKAHYRFYCYTRSAISIDGSKDPPPAGAPYWSTITQPVRVEDPPPPPPPVDPSNPGNVPDAPEPTFHTEHIPIGGVDWAVGTHPMVCSTFVWAAVRAAEKELGRKIVLEGPIEPLDNSGKPHRALGSQDGLYAYSEKERQDSASTLHAALVRQVHESLEEQASGFIGLVADFFAWTSDIADDVATQNVNAFAVDRADETDDQLYESPGEGDSVGPDDILLNWDAPNGADREGFRGLYGDQVPALLVQGAYTWAADFKYQLASGMAHTRVRMNFTDPTTGLPRLVRALVTLGCEVGHTNAHGVFSALVGAAMTVIKANAWDTVLGVWLKHESTHDLHEGINILDLNLEAPPLWRRRITWFGETRIYHNPDIGDKQQRTEPFASSTVLAWDPDVMSNSPPANVVDYMTHVTIGGGSVHFDEHYVTYAFEVHLQSDGSIVYDGICDFFVDGDRQDDQRRTFNGTIALDGSKIFKYEVTHDAFLDSHDYGRVVLTVQNVWAKY